jgi:hypothetical protein
MRRVVNACNDILNHNATIPKTLWRQSLTELLPSGIALAHLRIAPTVALSVDAAHYALYARPLQRSYYDHSPMVGWLLWLLTPLGLNELTLRIPPALIYQAYSGLFYHISANAMTHGTPARILLAWALLSIIFAFALDAAAGRPGRRYTRALFG